jgi:aspartate aminotransferase
MSISELVQSIADSPTLKLNERARQLREKGEPVIHLGTGEPTNKIPMAAILSATACLTSGDVKYTPTTGLPALKKAIVATMDAQYGKSVQPRNVIVSEGAKHALYNILMAILNPGDEVLLLAPYWVSYPEMVRLCQGVPVIVTPEDGCYVPRLAQIEEALSPRTKAIIVNSPNNPSGAVYSEALIADLANLCKERDLYLVMDDIYNRLVFDGKQAPSIYRFADEDLESSKVVVLNGISKAYGMTGFRIGWAVAAAELVGAMAKVQAQMTSCASEVSQAAALGALTGDQGVVEALRLTIQNNRDVMLQELRTISGVRVAQPEGTFYCLPDFRAYSSDSRQLAEFLLEKALVVTVAGAEFGMEGHLRLSYAGETKDIMQGVARLRWALDPEAAPEISAGSRKLVRDWQSMERKL